MAEPNVHAKGGKVLVKISDKWKEREKGAESKGMNVMNQGKSSITLVFWERLKVGKQDFLSAQLYWAPERMESCIC